MLLPDSGVVEGTGDGRSQEAIKRADSALYEAKEEGRNGVRAFLSPTQAATGHG